MKVAVLILNCLIVATLCMVAVADEPQWFLMARHGECAPIAVLERKLAGVSTLKHPDELVSHMRGQGLNVEVVSRDLNMGIVEIKVPEKALSLVLVQASLCREYLKPR